MNQLIPVDWLEAIIKNTSSFIFALIMTVLGYFTPVKNIVHLLLFFFLLDVIFGYLAAKKLRNECFNVKIIWNHTIPRMVISIVAVFAAFMWDTTYGQDFVSSYKLIGWFISGILFISFLQNGFEITKWQVLSDIGNIVKNKIETKTGEPIDFNKQTPNE